MPKYGPSLYGEETTFYGALPLSAMSANPMVAKVIAFGIVDLTWTYPTVPGIDSFRIVRNQTGHPFHETDGVVLFHQDTLPEGVSSRGLTDGVENLLDPGRFAYYSAFIKISGGWRRVGRTQVLIPGRPTKDLVNRGTAEDPIYLDNAFALQDVLLDLLPRVLTSKDRDSIGVVDKDSTLARFLSASSLPAEEIRTLADLTLPSANKANLPPGLLGPAFRQAGIKPESGLPIVDQKRVLREAYDVASRRGTAAGLGNYVESLTGWSPTVALTGNLLRYERSSTFRGGVGEWGVVGTAATLGINLFGTAMSVLDTGTLTGSGLTANPYATLSASNTYAVSGSYSLKCVALDDFGGFGTNPDRLTVPVTNATYVISIKVRVGEPVAADVLTKVQWYDTSDALLSISSAPTVRIGNGSADGWQTITFEATAPSNAAYVRGFTWRMRTSGLTHATGDVLYIDDWTMQQRIEFPPTFASVDCSLTEVATVTNKALTANVATLTTASAHGRGVGESITVSGVDSTFNGTYTTIAGTTGSTIKYARTATDVTSAAATGKVYIPLSWAPSVGANYPVTNALLVSGATAGRLDLPAGGWITPSTPGFFRVKPGSTYTFSAYFRGSHLATNPVAKTFNIMARGYARAESSGHNNAWPDRSLQDYLIGEGEWRSDDPFFWPRSQSTSFTIGTGTSQWVKKSLTMKMDPDVNYLAFAVEWAASVIDHWCITAVSLVEREFDTNGNMLPEPSYGYPNSAVVTVSPARTNLVTNPSFAGGVTTGWVKDGLTTMVLSTNKPSDVMVANSIAVASTAPWLVSTTVTPPLPGTPIAASAYVRGPSGSVITLGLDGPTTSPSETSVTMAATAIALDTISIDGGVMTVSTRTPHGMTVGESIVMAGNPTFNGTYTVSRVLSATMFTLPTARPNQTLSPAQCANMTVSSSSMKWQRVNTTLTLPEGDANPVMLYVKSSTLSGVEIAGVMAEQGMVVAGDYFDGDSPGQYGTEWRGTAYQSVSDMYPGKVIKAVRLGDTLDQYVPRHIGAQVVTLRGTKVAEVRAAT